MKVKIPCLLGVVLYPYLSGLRYPQALRRAMYRVYDPYVVSRLLKAPKQSMC